MTAPWTEATWAGRVTHLEATDTDEARVTVRVGTYAFTITLPADHQPPALGEPLELVLRRSVS